MISKYDVGDRVILTGTVERIEQRQNGTVLYTLRGCDASVPEADIVGRVEEPWVLTRAKLS